MPDGLYFLIVTVLALMAASGMSHLSLAWNRYTIKDRVPRATATLLRLVLAFAAFSCFVFIAVLVFLVSQRFQHWPILCGATLGVPLGVIFVKLLVWSDARTAVRFRR